jgi:hypothetical protein
MLPLVSELKRAEANNR